MLSLELAKAQVSVLRQEARMARGHDGVPTVERMRSIVRRRAAR
jgi:hypothetical protein